jgi:hypothetical protein
MPIVLDTNIVRDLGASRLDAAQFDQVKMAGISIHLSDTAASELSQALLEGRFWWDQWARAKAIVVRLVDHDEPILLGGGQGLSRAGLVPQTSPSRMSPVSDAIEAYAAGWELLIKAESLEELRRAEATPIGATASYQFGAVNQVMSAEKSEWVEDFKAFDQEILAAVPDLPSRLPARGDSREALEMFMNVLREGIDRVVPGVSPRASTRLDAFLRVHALLRLRSLRRKEQYNPEKDANDALDHTLLRYLAHPAAVCTRERGIFADVEATGSWQRKWIVTPEDLARVEVVEELADMRWPDEPPNMTLNLTGADAPAG